MKNKWFCIAIPALLIILIGAGSGCVTVVKEDSASTTEQPVTPPPTINSFAASPTSINQGQRTTLSWDVSGTTTVTIEPEIGTVGPSGSLLLTPAASVTYTLTAANQGGSATRSVSVAVTPGFAGKPDLVITDIWLSGGQINYKIANIGSGDAKSSQSYLYVNDTKQGTDWVDSLAAGEEITTAIPNFEWKILTGATPAGEPIGHYVRICADAGNAIDENDNENNCLTKNWGQPFSYDFVDNAHLAEWRSGAAVISWPKFAGNQAGAAYTEGTALIMCPEQVSNGWIQGRFADFHLEVPSQPSASTFAGIRRSSLLKVPENARFTAEVGFRPGTTSTDGAGIALGYVDEAGSIVLFPVMELSPGDKSRNYTVDLSSLADKETEFVLRVEARGSPEGNCVRWVEPKIVSD